MIHLDAPKKFDNAACRYMDLKIIYTYLYIFLIIFSSNKTMELKSSKNKPPIGAIIVAKLVNPNIIVKWEAETQMDIGDGVQLRTCPSIARYLARSKSHLNLYGGDNIEKNTEIDHWLTFTLGSLSNTADFKKALEYLESILAPVTFLVGDSISIADYVVFGTLYASGFWMVSLHFVDF